MRRGSLVLLSLLLLGMAGEPYRYSRDLEAAAGWSVLELPDDVLAAARPGLPDLRISGKDGELGYVLEHELATVAPRVEVRNVESRPGRDTTAVLDRGASPGLCSELALEVAGSAPFLKPFSVEASPDGREFAEIARGSVFRLSSGVASSRLGFAPNDRRFLRVRLDDRNGEPVTPLAARCREASTPEAPLRDVALGLERRPGDASVDRFSLVLPSANLPIASLRLTVNGLAFAREARVYEPVVFRDELSRRLVGFGRLERGANGEGNTTLPVGELAGSVLELEIDRAGAPLDVRDATASVRRTRIVFVAPAEPSLTLLYGSESARAPSYDLGAALARGRPTSLAPAELGAVKDAGAPVSPSAPARSKVVEPEGWKRRQRIALPPRGPVAYLDLERAEAERVHQIRIVDAAGRQVPFLVEADTRTALRELRFTQTNDGAQTRVEVALDPTDPISALEVAVASPEYFERDVTVFVPMRDARGTTGQREVARASWVRRPEDKDASLSIPLAASGESELVLTTHNAENPPLVITKVMGRAVKRRIDFAFNPGETLELWSDNERAQAPRYDLRVISSTVLKSPALPATLVPPAVTAAATKEPGTPPWFWWVVVGSGLLVVLVLVRVQKKPA